MLIKFIYNFCTQCQLPHFNNGPHFKFFLILSRNSLVFQLFFASGFEPNIQSNHYIYTTPLISLLEKMTSSTGVEQPKAHYQYTIANKRSSQTKKSPENSVFTLGSGSLSLAAACKQIPLYYI